ncbi:MAG: NADPH-dependent FMN reductase [Vicingaceae bacterium]
MNILLISASASPNSGNYYLLKAIAELFEKEHEVEVYQGLYEFELFSPPKLEQGIPNNISALQAKIKAADLIFLSTPEYTHNIPAVLKNLIEWCTASGEFSGKRLVPLTFTPHEPRGEYAMNSLTPSLQALEAEVLTQLPLYKSQMDIQEGQIILPDETKEMLQSLLSFF